MRRGAGGLLTRPCGATQPGAVTFGVTLGLFVQLASDVLQPLFDAGGGTVLFDERHGVAGKAQRRHDQHDDHERFFPCLAAFFAFFDFLLFTHLP